MSDGNLPGEWVNSSEDEERSGSAKEMKPPTGRALRRSQESLVDEQDRLLRELEKDPVEKEVPEQSRKETILAFVVNKAKLKKVEEKLKEVKAGEGGPPELSPVAETTSSPASTVQPLTDRLSQDDEDAFRAQVALEVPVHLVAQVAPRVDLIVARSKTLAEAQMKWARAKPALGIQAPVPAPVLAGGGVGGVAGQLLPGDNLANAVRPCVSMNGDELVTAGNRHYIVWTGGAASCVAIGVYNGKTAWIKHATSIDLNPNMVDSLVGEVKFKAGTSPVHVSCQLINHSEAQGLVTGLIARGLVVHQYQSGRLAINANTGAVLVNFPVAGLPK